MIKEKLLEKRWDREIEMAGKKQKCVDKLQDLNA